MLKIGIFFGGTSREREVSFAGGRTVYDNLNKELFEPIPIFIDSKGSFILLNWEFLYKGTIRDFFPVPNLLPEGDRNFQVYVESLEETLSEDQYWEMVSQIGRKVQPDEFSKLMDVAFLALHGPYGEDGNIQGLLEWYGVPYTGSGIYPSAIGIDKGLQKELFQKMGQVTLKSKMISFGEWGSQSSKDLFEQLKVELGFPLVVKAPHQGSSVGVSVLVEDTEEAFAEAFRNAFFIEEVGTEWRGKSDIEKQGFLSHLVDIRAGIGLPLTFSSEEKEATVIHHPDKLWEALDKHFTGSDSVVQLQALDHEASILVEEFVQGKEFSCIVIQDENGSPLALPPTEIIKSNEIFDYRAKYLPGISRKVTPIDLPETQIDAVRYECEALFKLWNFNVYARIDGFITPEGSIYLNDPNTTSGMLPSSFFFHQAAEIGMNPSQFLTYIIRTSLEERIKSGKKMHTIKALLYKLDQEIMSLHKTEKQKTKVAVIMGGYSTERHISVESGRNIFEKLASSGQYEPIPIFLSGNEKAHQLYLLPINIMLKDNADDIREKVEASLKGERHLILDKIIDLALPITQKYAGTVQLKAEKVSYEQLRELVNVVFIALHGRPGEDGAVQAKLEEIGLPYNGSGVQSSQTTIDKYLTKQILRENGFQVAQDLLVKKENWSVNPASVYEQVESKFPYPFIAKPSDDGCSSAVKKIDDRMQLEAFCKLLFREEVATNLNLMDQLGIHQKEEIPQKEWFMVEQLIRANGADHFLEITGGLLTQYLSGQKVYEIFEPSEALATDGILSLEEKFLAGEGQNITPARFSPSKEEQFEISKKVRRDLEKVAKVLKVEGYARIDAFVRIFKESSKMRVETIVIEVNSLPGMTPATCIFHQTAINGYKPYQFIDRILQFGIEKRSAN